MMSRPSSFVLAVATIACALALTAAARKETQTEEKAIRDLDRRWVESVAARDLDGTVAHYADDAAFLPPDASAVHGKPAIRAAWGELLKTPGMTLAFEPTTIRVARAGDMAYELGTYAMGADAIDGRTEERGKYVVVWTRVGGGWKVAADIFNGDGPPAAPAAGVR